VGAVAEADGGGGGALLWKDLALFLVMDALNDAFAHSRHGGSADADADESVLEWTLLLVLALRRVLSAEADELRRHTDIFLRLRGSTHPLLRMPSWRWLCARTAHDVKQTLIAGSDGFGATSPVGTYVGGFSPFGLADASGNVAEWVSDWFGAYVATPVTDPAGPSSGSERVIRGGHWFANTANQFSTTARSPLGPSVRLATLGLRCSHAPEVAPPPPPPPVEEPPPPAEEPGRRRRRR
jgi:hypothetical protein